jgi:hypothetical protein
LLAGLCRCCSSKARFANMGENVRVAEGGHAAVKLTLIPESYVNQ